MALNMTMGRPKLEIPRNERINLRLTKSELEELEKICAKLKITKTEAVLRGLNLLKTYKPKIYRNQLPNFVPKKVNEQGVTFD